MLFAAATALLAFPLSAWAGPPIVRWDRVEGVIGADLTQVQVGPFAASTRWRSTGSGRVMLNLGTGFLSLRITGVSWAQHYSNGPLGSPTPLPGGSLIGTVVCNSTERFGPITWVDTPVVAADSGSLTWQGFLDLPAACREYPQELVFLVRHLDGPPFFGAFVLYGAEGSIR
jgi:hypothetical protein